MSDVNIAAAIIEQYAVAEDYANRKYRCTNKSARNAAQALINAGYKLRDPELEARVDRIERWMRGEF